MTSGIVMAGKRIRRWRMSIAAVMLMAFASGCRDIAPPPSACHGCATAHNLALLAADPADLAVLRAAGPRASERRDRVVDSYLRGRRTGAERTLDERARVAQGAGGGS